MAQIDFYHCTRTKPLVALPKLLARALASGARACVACDPSRVAAVDDALWDDPAWLPHGTAADGDADLQPIWLLPAPPPATAPNGAAMLFLLDAADAMDGAAYARIFDLFDGTDEAATSAARARFRTWREAGHTLAYWKQTASGWEKG